MKIDDNVVRQMWVEEESSRNVHIVSLFPEVPAEVVKEAFVDVTVGIAKKDPEISRLARQLSDEVHGLAFTGALRVLAQCGMVMNKMDREK